MPPWRCCVAVAMREPPRPPRTSRRRLAVRRLAARELPGRAPGRPAHRLEIDVAVGAAVLHGLEGADRHAELHALRHVVGGDLERALGDADLHRARATSATSCSQRSSALASASSPPSTSCAGASVRQRLKSGSAARDQPLRDPHAGGRADRRERRADPRRSWPARERAARRPRPARALLARRAGSARPRAARAWRARPDRRSPHR